MLPVTNEQAKAVQKAAELGITIVDESSTLARYVGKILGTVPENAVGIVLGEPLRLVRAVIASKVDERIRMIHEARNVTEVQPVSPSLAIPLLQAAYDESRPELQQMWAELIAAAMDPKRVNRVRKRFIDTVKQLDPLDALMLKERAKSTGDLAPTARAYMIKLLNISHNEYDVSLQNLVRLECVGIPPVHTQNFHLTSYGSELVRACSD